MNVVLCVYLLETIEINWEANNILELIRLALFRGLLPVRQGKASLT